MKYNIYILIKSFVQNGKFKPIITGLALSILITACGSSAANNESVLENAENNKKVVETSVVTAVSKDVPKYIQANGTFTADETTQVAPEISGIVEASFVKEGDFVNVGSVIFKLSEKDARLRLDQMRAAEMQAQTQIRQAEATLKQTQAQIGLDKTGSFVAKNVPAVREARAALVSAESDLKLAQSNERRYANLLDTGDTSKMVYDQRRNELEKAQATVNEAQERLANAENSARGGNQAIEAAKANLENTRAALLSAQAQTALAEKTVKDTNIRAPLSGFVSQKQTAVGQYVSPSSPVLTIVRTNPIKLQINLPETQAGMITNGMEVSANVIAFTDRSFAGRVRAINPNLNEAVRSLTVDAVMENPDNLLRPGMFGSVKISQSSGDNGIFIPESAIIRNKNTNSNEVFVIENGIARLRVIELDEKLPVENGEVRVLSGIKETEILANANLDQLYDGAQPTIKN